MNEVRKNKTNVKLKLGIKLTNLLQLLENMFNRKSISSKLNHNLKTTIMFSD